MPVILSRKGGGSGGGGGAPSGPAGGDLTGNYPNPTIDSGVITAAMFATGLSPWTELFSSVLGADTNSIDTGAGGFSTSFDHLLVIGQFRTTEAAILSNVGVRANNDTGGNWDRQTVFGRNASTTTEDAQAATSILGSMAGASAATGVAATFFMVVPFYGLTTLEKSGIILSGFADEAATGGDVRMSAWHWRNTAAINRLAFIAAAGNLLAGSGVTVYGIG